MSGGRVAGQILPGHSSDRVVLQALIAAGRPLARREIVPLVPAHVDVGNAITTLERLGMIDAVEGERMSWEPLRPLRYRVRT